MRITFIILLSIGFCTCTAPTKTQEPLSGIEIYKAKCMTCHGVDGKMGMNGAKDLQVSMLTAQQRVTVIKNGQDLMPSFQGLMSEDEIKAVAEYTVRLK